MKNFNIPKPNQQKNDYRKTDSNQEKIKNGEEKDYDEAKKKEYLFYIQDYANKIWSMAAHFSYDCENDIKRFKEYAKSRPLPKIEDCYTDREGILKHCEKEVAQLDNIIARINSADDEATFKRLINAALFLIYPNKGCNQEYKEEEFSSEEV